MKQVAEYIIPIIQDGKNCVPDFLQAKELIRCMDCKYWSTETEQTAVPNMHKCTWWRTIGTLPIDFCSRAERRGEE